MDGRPEQLQKGLMLQIFRLMVKIQVLGRQIIKVTHVSTREFENNPNMIWNYDVMMHGTWDGNARDSINNNGIGVIENYIKAGKGVITGHDSIGDVYGTKVGMGRIRNYFNIKVRKLCIS